MNGTERQEGKAGKGRGEGKWRSAKSTIEASTDRELEPSQAEFQAGHWRHIKGVISAAGGRKFDNSRGVERGVRSNQAKGQRGKRDEGVDGLMA